MKACEFLWRNVNFYECMWILKKAKYVNSYEGILVLKEGLWILMKTCELLWRHLNSYECMLILTQTRIFMTNINSDSGVPNIKYLHYWSIRQTMDSSWDTEIKGGY